MEEVIFYELLEWTELWQPTHGRWKNAGAGDTRNCTRNRAACQQNRDTRGKSGEEQTWGVPSHFSPPFPGIGETETQSTREINCDGVNPRIAGTTKGWAIEGLIVSFLLKLVVWNIILNIMNGISRWGPREMVGSWDKTHDDRISVPLIKRPQRAIVWLQC